MGKTWRGLGGVGWGVLGGKKQKRPEEEDPEEAGRRRERPNPAAATQDLQLRSTSFPNKVRADGVGVKWRRSVVCICLF